MLALDPGSRRIGVAISDGLRITAQPLMVIDRNLRNPFDVLRELLAEYEIDVIVIGLPVGLSGREGPAAEAARRFADEVGQITEVSVEMVDERFSTRTAEETMLTGGAKRSTRRTARDKVAAAVILRSYLDRAR